MSQLSTVPVIKCTHCGNPMKLSYLGTTKADADGKLLFELFRGMAKTALCGRCQQQYNQLAKEGRMKEWTQNLWLNIPDR